MYLCKSNISFQVSILFSCITSMHALFGEICTDVEGEARKKVLGEVQEQDCAGRGQNGNLKKDLIRQATALRQEADKIDGKPDHQTSRSKNWPNVREFLVYE